MTNAEQGPKGPLPEQDGIPGPMGEPLRRAEKLDIKIFTCAHVPEALQQKWLQHLRDFDTANPGCHFEVGIDGPEEPFAAMLKRLTVEPGLTFTKIYERAKWSKG